MMDWRNMKILKKLKSLFQRKPRVGVQRKPSRLSQYNLFSQGEPNHQGMYKARIFCCGLTGLSSEAGWLETMVPLQVGHTHLIKGRYWLCVRVTENRAGEVLAHFRPREDYPVKLNQEPTEENISEYCRKTNQDYYTGREQLREIAYGGKPPAPYKSLGDYFKN